MSGKFHSMARVAAAAVLLVACRLGLGLFSYRRLVRWIGQSAGTAESGAAAAATDNVRRAVLLARRMVPGSTCLPQALATQVLLRCYGVPSRIVIGVAKPDAASLHAHAWVESGGATVIGESADLGRYTEVPGV